MCFGLVGFFALVIIWETDGLVITHYINGNRSPEYDPGLRMQGLV